MDNEEDFKCLKNIIVWLLIIQTVVLFFTLFIQVFIFYNFQNNIHETQVVEYVLESPCIKQSDEVYASLLSRFPYKKTIATKNDSCFYIAYMISVVLMLSTIIICLTILFIKINNHNLILKKMFEVKMKFKEIDFSKTDSILQQKDGTSETEYYPKNKALVDNFKAYANAIAEL